MHAVKNDTQVYYYFYDLMNHMFSIMYVFGMLYTVTIRNSNGIFVSGCQMVQYSNGGLKTRL